MVRCLANRGGDILNLEFLDPCEVPPKCNRYLAYCRIGTWTGLMDVFYNPHCGWNACHEDSVDIIVLWYTEMPTVNGHSVYDKELS
jgi:hypothetical protein